MDFTILLLIFLGSSILLSIIFSKTANSLRSPLIVGYIFAGAFLILLFGPKGFLFPNIIPGDFIHKLDIVNIVTLSLLGFGIGGELRWSELKKLGKSIVIIVLFEASLAFLVVGVVTGILLKNIPMGIIYGALASATAPAGTVDVIKEYRAKGNLTTTLYAVMGLDDIYALLIYTISIPIAVNMLGGDSSSTIFHALSKAGIEVLFSILLGIVSGYILAKISKKIHNHTTMLLFTLGLIILNCGIAELFELSPILLSMASGIVLVNMSSITARKIFKTLGDWTPPVYVWFFVLIGMRLDISLIMKYALIVFLYIIARTAGKWSGAFLGATVSKADSKIKKYLGFTLLSQAGVAIGLALAAAKSLEKLNLHHQAVQIMSVMTATTFIIMLVGPLLAKVALFKAGEAKVSK